MSKEIARDRERYEEPWKDPSWPHKMTFASVMQGNERVNLTQKTSASAEKILGDMPIDMATISQDPDEARRMSKPTQPTVTEVASREKAKDLVDFAKKNDAGKLVK